MKRELLEKLERLGDKYLAVKVKADAYSTLRVSVGQRVVRICRKHGKKRSKIEQDSKTLIVGYDEATKYTVDVGELRVVLDPLGLWEQITETTVNHDKLAQVLESGDLSPEQYRQVKRAITSEVTYRPFIRRK